MMLGTSPSMRCLLICPKDKVKGIFGIDYEIKFSLLYSTGDGQVFQTKNFYNVEMPGKEGMIPNYILKTLEEEEVLEIKFNLDDLSVLYDERNIKIDEESTFGNYSGIKSY